MRKIRVLLLILIACCAPNASAQQAPSSAAFDSGSRNWSIGLRTGIRFLNPISSVDAAVSDADTDPPQTTTIASKSTAKRYPVGPTVHYQVSDRWGITFDALFSRVGYDASSTTETQPDPDDENSEAEFISALYERTRADFWDFPVMARYYCTGFQEDPARLFIAGGLGVRTVSGIKTFSESVVGEDEELRDTSAEPVTPARRTVLGAVVSGGFRLQDEVGLKIDLEVRYTRWVQRIFDSSVARSSPNEGAVTVSFSF